jgi:hypothetical protein
MILTKRGLHACRPAPIYIIDIHSNLIIAIIIKNKKGKKDVEMKNLQSLKTLEQLIR